VESRELEVEELLKDLANYEQQLAAVTDTMKGYEEQLVQLKDAASQAEVGAVIYVHYIHLHFRVSRFFTRIDGCVEFWKVYCWRFVIKLNILVLRDLLLKDTYPQNCDILSLVCHRFNGFRS